jgi:predicted RNA binding protein YcfA (HicA-like mRNA interferase family)
MPSLPTLTGKDVVAAFEKLGFEVARITDSHHILKKPGFKYNLSVPIHKQKNIKPGTLRTLIRKAEVTIEAFCKALD